jgi:hypothetical protein
MTRVSRVSENPKVPEKVQAAFRLMVDDPAMTLQLAAAAVGLGSRQLRGALAAPHVRQWILDERRILLETINAANPEALRRIRDAADGNQMAQVTAVKVLETMRLSAVEETGGKPGVTRPGLQIVIHQIGGESRVVCGPAQTPMIDVTPEAASVDER